MEGNTESYLAHVSRRCHIALKTRTALPFHSLQYRLCEVGPHRLNPRELREALTPLLRDPTGILEIHPGIYTDPNVEIETLAKDVLRIQDTVHQLAAADNIKTFNRLLEILRDRFEGHPAHLPEYQRQRQLIPTANISTRDAILQIDRSGKSGIHIWVSWDADWIFPDNDRLWRFLQTCIAANAHPIILARRIAPSAFPLFKALGVFGVQYYAWLTSDTSKSALQKRADQAGFPNLKRVSSLASSAALDQLERAIVGRPHGDLEEIISQSILSANRYGLTESSTATFSALIAWANETDIELPEAWRSGIAYAIAPNRLARPMRAPMRRKHEESKAEQSTEERRPGFGRKTTVTRVPMRV